MNHPFYLFFQTKISEHIRRPILLIDTLNMNLFLSFCVINIYMYNKNKFKIRLVYGNLGVVYYNTILGESVKTARWRSLYFKLTFFSHHFHKSESLRIYYGNKTENAVLTHTLPERHIRHGNS